MWGIKDIIAAYFFTAVFLMPAIFYLIKGVKNMPVLGVINAFVICFIVLIVTSRKDKDAQ